MGGQQLTSKDKERIVKSAIENDIRRLVATNHPVFPFPSERKLLATLHNYLDSRRLSDSRLRVPRDILSRPVTDYIQFLNRVSDSFPRIPELRIGYMADLVKYLEEQVLRGGIGFKGERPSRVLEYSIGDGKNIDVYGVSSIVKSLAGLDVYMAHVAKPRDLLVIDEPEMNAHPDAQLFITELLAMMVKRGIRVVITTHSPYIV